MERTIVCCFQSSRYVSEYFLELPTICPISSHSANPLLITYSLPPYKLRTLRSFSHLIDDCRRKLLVCQISTDQTNSIFLFLFSLLPVRLPDQYVCSGKWVRLLPQYLCLCLFPVFYQFLSKRLGKRISTNFKVSWENTACAQSTLRWADSGHIPSKYLTSIHRNPNGQC